MVLFPHNVGHMFAVSDPTENNIETIRLDMNNLK